MSKSKLPLGVLLAIQIVAILIYPPAFFQRAPQAFVMPPALVMLFVLAIVGINTHTLSPELTRVSLIFIQGINMCIRIVTLFPNLMLADGSWAWPLLFTQIVGLALSWYAMIAMEHRSMEGLRLRQVRS